MGAAEQIAIPSAAHPQVFLMIADPLLEGLYRKRMQDQRYLSVWWEQGHDWQASLVNFNYDIIIVDFSLFPEDPISELRQIRKLAPDADIVVLSHGEDVRTAVAAFKTGISDYLLKPVEPEQLAWSVEKLLRRKEFKITNEILTLDLLVFRAAHQISIADTDAKMRELAARYLIRILGARGAVWLWSASPERISGNKLKNEYFSPSHEEADRALKNFRLRYPRLIEESFQSGGSVEPEEWFHGRSCWIPFKLESMGGIYLFGIGTIKDESVYSRVEFLVRNVEISLDNWKRYLDAKQLTYTDDFTGLYNSRYLDIALTAAVQEATARQSRFAVLFIDIDHFKSVNDKYGHLVGSAVLNGMAQTLKRSMRGRDQLFRYGGDEFIVVLHSVGAREAKEVAERLRAKVERQKFRAHGIELKVTVSIGVSSFPEHAKDKRRILELADQAMYSGKKRGRNTVFDASDA